eukprot:963851-Rhodomonas_salina.1
MAVDVQRMGNRNPFGGFGKRRYLPRGALHCVLCGSGGSSTAVGRGAMYSTIVRCGVLQAPVLTSGMVLRQAPVLTLGRMLRPAPVLTSGMCYGRLQYGTDRRGRQVLPQRQYGSAIPLRARYPMSGTDRECSAMRYAIALHTRCMTRSDSHGSHVRSGV